MALELQAANSCFGIQVLKPLLLEFFCAPWGIFRPATAKGVFGDLEGYALVVTPKVIQHDFPVGDVHLGSHGEIDDSSSTWPISTW